MQLTVPPHLFPLLPGRLVSSILWFAQWSLNRSLLLFSDKVKWKRDALPICIHCCGQTAIKFVFSFWFDLSSVPDKASFVAVIIWFDLISGWEASLVPGRSDQPEQWVSGPPDRRHFWGFISWICSLSLSSGLRWGHWLDYTVKYLRPNSYWIVYFVTLYSHGIKCSSRFLSLCQTRVTWGADFKPQVIIT